MFKFDFEPTDFHLQFDANKLHSLLRNGLTIKPGEVKLLHLQFFTNTQIVSLLQDINSESVLDVGV